MASKVTDKQLHGLDIPLEQELHLKAGKYEATFEPVRGYLRRLRLGDREFVRCIYLHLRDQNWGTVMPTVTVTKQVLEQDHSLVEWHAVSKQGNIDFEWTGKIEGHPDGTFDYVCNGIAKTTFLSNRTGLCLLVPEEYGGTNCDVLHPDGTQTTVEFPTRIITAHPITDVHELRYGNGVICRFQGDVFEQEDQRNWTDASYKTYSLCGRQPKPFPIKAGENIDHSVHVILPVGRAADEAPIALLTPDGGHLPLLGTTVKGDASDIADVAKSHLSFLRLELALKDKAAARALLEHYISAAKPLRVVIDCSVEAAAGDAAFLSEFSDKIELLVVRGPHKGVADPKTFAAFAAAFAGKISSGTPSFDGLSGQVEEMAVVVKQANPKLSGIEFGAMPQIHTFDERSILENGRTLTENALSASTLADGAPATVVVSMNSAGDDPRFTSLFGALWTLQCVTALAKRPASSASLVHLEAPEGLRGTPSEILLSKLKPGKPTVALSDSDPAKVVVLAFQLDGKNHLLIGNLLRQPQTIHLKDAPSKREILNFDGFEDVKAAQMLELDPYRIELIKF